MSFSNPMYLWGFLGILIPIAIHLWNKKEGKTVKIGSIKLLNESTSKKSSRLQFNELVLLLIRIVLICLLVLSIASPQIIDSKKSTSTAYIIEPSLLTHEKVIRILDTVSSNTTLRLLQTGLPEFQKNKVNELDNNVPNYWQLSKEMEAIKAANIIVFTRSLLSGIKGKRPTNYNSIKWIVINSEDREKKWIQAVKKKDSIELLSVVSNTRKMYFEKKTIGKNTDEFALNKQKDSILFDNQSDEYSIALEHIDTINIAIFYDDSLKDQVPFIESVSHTLANYLERPIKVSKYQNIDIQDDYLYDLIVWFRKENLPAIAAKKIMYRPDLLANQLIESSNSRSLFFLTKKLTITNSLEEHLSERFLEILALNQKVAKKVKRYDKRSISQAQLIPSKIDIETMKTNTQTTSPVSKWLWVFVGMILILERIIAKHRKQ